MERHQRILDISNQDEDFWEYLEYYELPINNIDFVNINEDSEYQNDKDEDGEIKIVENLDKENEEEVPLCVARREPDRSKII